jgi:hypothetical protein
MRYVAAGLIEMHGRRMSADWKGMQFTYRPDALPHFLSHFEPIVK